MAVSKLQNYIEKYGLVAGPKLYLDAAPEPGSLHRGQLASEADDRRPDRDADPDRASAATVRGRPAPLLAGSESGHGGASSIDFREAEEIV